MNLPPVPGPGVRLELLAHRRMMVVNEGCELEVCLDPCSVSSTAGGMDVVQSSACLRPCGVARGLLQQDGGCAFCHALVVGLSGVRVRLWLDGNDD